MRGVGVLAPRAEVLRPVNVGGGEVLGRVAECDAHLRHSVERRFVGMYPQPGFHRPRWVAHFSGRVQERVQNAVIARDARGVAF